MNTKSLETVFVKASAAILLAFSLTFSSAAPAQELCPNDGVRVEFVQVRGGVMELRAAKTKDIFGKNLKDVNMGAAGTHSTSVQNGKFTVNSLDLNNFPNLNINNNSFQRVDNNVWEANFPRGLYEFRNKNDLRIEVIATVSDGLAMMTEGNEFSAVSLDVDVGKIHEVWYGGKGNTLKIIRGGLNFRFSDFDQLRLAGFHQTNLNVCLKIEGYL